MSACGIDIRGRSRKLYLNYRTTEEIRRQAIAALEGCEVDDLDEGSDEVKRYKSLSHGAVPKTLDLSTHGRRTRQLAFVVTAKHRGGKIGLRDCAEKTRRSFSACQFEDRQRLNHHHWAR